MSLCNKAIDLSSWTVTVTEVTPPPAAVADFQITDPNNLLSESGLIKAILSAAVGDYRVDNSLDSRPCDSGECGCAFGPAEGAFYWNDKKVRYTFPETGHTIVEDDLTVEAPFEYIY